ncbi:pyridoxal-phosphate dependent enzyme [Aureococcus anophagefferens]|nr:pyridoxal-phosphate dependent enzyme [Aureococcus anophagefferens]
MPAVARALGVARVVAKDESDRFGTGSFKALGGALVVDELRETREHLSVATASAGNHGLGVAWGARNAGAEAVVYLGNQVSEAMADRMRALGASVVRAGESYEASVAKCKADAAEQGHVIIQDVGVPGVYEDIPRTIHAGRASSRRSSWAVRADARARERGRRRLRRGRREHGPRDESRRGRIAAAAGHRRAR